jgi:L-ascorbate metabolism protein UlaG (beta-lactamase superfamily)
MVETVLFLRGTTMKKLKVLRAAIPATALVVALLSAGALSAQTLQGDSIPAASGGPIVVHPMYHATFAMSWNGKVIYVDPAPAPGAALGSTATAAFKGLPPANIILVTDIHGDHFNAASLTDLAGPNTRIVAPQAVIDQMPDALKAKATAVANGQTVTVDTIPIEGVPMYNITEDRLKFHNKGRGNGYVVTLGGRRVYIAGDTEAHPEMKALKSIDVAFIPFNLPYTMTPEQAAEGVLAFKPRIVYPYHYRGSDMAAFAKAVSADKNIEIRQRNWYPAN